MVRISAQLVDGWNGTERWSDVYDRPFGDTLKIQTEIATMVAQSLSIHLEGAEQRALKEGGTQNSEAQDLLLNAQGIVWRKDDADSLRRALELVDRALAVDSRYADALSAKASIVGYLGSFYGTSSRDSREKTDESERLARRAIAIAPASALAHAALAKTLWSDLRLRAGLAEFEKSGTLPNTNKSFFNGFDSYAVALGCCRRFDAAIARADQLVAADPLNPNAFSTKGLVLAHQRRFAEGREIMAQAVALGPDLLWPRAFQAYFMMQTGKLQEAEKAFADIPGIGPWLSWAAVLAERQGDRAEADRLVALMQRDMGDAGYFQYAEVFAQQGRLDQAVDVLTKALVARDPGLSFLRVDAMLDPLRTDPRFEAIVKRLDFPT